MLRLEGRPFICIHVASESAFFALVCRPCHDPLSPPPRKQSRVGKSNIMIRRSTLHLFDVVVE